MPSTTIAWDQVTALNRNFHIPKLRDNFFLGDPLMMRLKSRIKRRPLGRLIIAPLLYNWEGNGGEWYAANDTHDTTIRNPITAATFTPKNSIVPIAIDEQEELEATTPDKVLDMMEEKMQVAENTARELHGINVFNAGTNPKAITGLQYALPVSSAGNKYIAAQTYGGILSGGALPASDAFGWWQPNADGSNGTNWVAGSGGTFMYAGAANPISAMFGRIGLRTNREPTLIVSNWASWTDYHNSLSKMETYFRPQQNSELAKAGFRNLMYRNAPWIADARAPRTGTSIETVYVIDEDALTLYWDTRRDFFMEPWRKPYNQSTRVAYIKNRFELVFAERRTSGTMQVDCSAVF